MLKGIGDVIESGVKVADFGVRDYLATNIRSEVEGERQKLTDAANLGLDVASGKITPTIETDPSGIGHVSVGTTEAKDAEGPLDLLSRESQAPGQLKNDLSRSVSTLQSAKDARKIPDIMYDSQLSAIAKRYRSQFPGYSDYIDNIVSGITGRDPANHYIQGVLSLLAATKAGAEDGTKRDLALMDKYIELPGMDMMQQRYKTGATDPFTGRPVDGNSIRSFINKHTVAKWNSEQGDRELKDVENDVKLSKIFGTARAQSLSIETADKYFYSMQAAGGKTLDELVNDPEITKNPERLAELIPALQNMKAGYLKEFRALTTKVPEGSRRSTAEAVGDDINKIATEGGAVFDNMIKAYTEGNAAKAAVLANAVKVRTNQATLKLWNDPRMAPFMDIMSGVEKFGPEFQGLWYRGFIQRNQQLQGGIGQYIGEQMTKAITQPERQTTGETFTLIQAIKDAKEKKLPVAQVFGQYFELIDGDTGLTGTKTPISTQVEIARFLFDPKNLPLLQEFEAGDGRNRLYQRLTNGNVTEVMEKLKKVDRTLWTNYKDFSTHSFQNVLFKQDIKELASIQKIPKTILEWNTDSRVPYWKLHDISKDQPTRNDAGRFAQIAYSNKVLNKLNGGISMITNILEKDGEPVVPYLMQTFQRAGLDLENISGLPADLYKSLVAESKKRAEDKKKKLEQYESK